MTKAVIRFVQEQLKARRLMRGPVGGDMGPKTLAALNKVDGLDRNWSKRRKAVGFIQLLAVEDNVETESVEGL